jgi:integrase
LYRYGPTGTIYWCRKLNGQNVWKNLQTADRKRAIAMTALYDYAATQNGNHEISVISLGSEAPKLLPQNVESAAPTPAVSSATPERTTPAPPTITLGVSLEALADRFRAESKHLAKSTRETMDYHFKVAGEFLDFQRDVATIRLADLRTLKSQLMEGRKPSTVNDIIFKGLGALFKIALEDGYIEKWPMEKLKRTHNREPDRQQPTWKQSQQILQSVTRSVAETGVIVGIMRHFGIGQAEIKHLDGAHIDLPRGEIHFRRKKTSKPFDVPIFPHAKGFIDSLIQQGRLTAGKPVVTWRNPRKALENACKELGLPIYSPRGLRRTFIVHCLETGVDPRVVAQWQGHGDATLILKLYGKYISKEHAAKMAQMLKS